jgi:hypothetical protein
MPFAEQIIGLHSAHATMGNGEFFVPEGQDCGSKTLRSYQSYSVPLPVATAGWGVLDLFTKRFWVVSLAAKPENWEREDGWIAPALMGGQAARATWDALRFWPGNCRAAILWA